MYSRNIQPKIAHLAYSFFSGCWRFLRGCQSLYFLFFVSFMLMIAQPIAIVYADQTTTEEKTIASPLQEDPFQLTVTTKGRNIIATWQIAPNHYLYKNQIRFKVLNPSGHQTVILGEPIWPPTQVNKEYPGSGEIPAYSGTVHIQVPVQKSTTQAIHLQIKYQGCSDKICYLPVKKNISVTLAQLPHPLTDDTSKTTNVSTSQSKVEKILNEKNKWLGLIYFFGFGLLLSLTPCVLPMIPILSSIIVNQENPLKINAFILSLAYVLGMSITYAIAGLIVALIGESLHTYLKTPWVLVPFSIIIVLMALSLFGFYDIQLPSSWQNRLTQLSGKQRGGSIIGAAIMGALSSLILSPCITPALVGALTYIAQTGNAAFGTTALFIMGLGMGIPLLIIGTFGLTLLPKTGPWTTAIKYMLGLLLLGIAIWVISPIITSKFELLLWSALFIGTATTLGAFSTATTLLKKIGKTLGLLFFIYGIMLIVSAFTNQPSLLSPFAGFYSKKMSAPTSETGLHFIPVESVADLKKELMIATSNQQFTMLDMYADWCIACHEMEVTLFNQPAVQRALQNFRLLRVNITQINQSKKNLLKSYQVIAPPTLLFFGRKGEELKNARIVGKPSSSEFIAHIQQIKKANP